MEEKLRNNSILNDRTELSLSDIILALKLCLEVTNLTSRGKLIVKSTELP